MSLHELQHIIQALATMQAGWDSDVAIDRIRTDIEDLYNRYPATASTTAEAISLGGVPCEWIATKGAVLDRVVLHLHGGGFVCGSIRSHRPLASNLSGATEASVLLAGYRLAPEHTYPAQLNDALSTYLSLLEKGLHPSRIAIFGDSAGAGLAIALMLTLRARDLPFPGCAVLLSPWIDMECSGETYISKASVDPVASREMALMMAQQYLGAKGDSRDPLASPIRADLSGLPPLFILAGDREIFLDDARALAERAKKDGVETRFEVWPGMIHQWPIFASALEEGRQALIDVGDFVRAKTNQGSQGGA